MSTEAAAGKKVILKSSDGETFEVDEVVALESQTIKQAIEFVCADDSATPLLNVSGKILSKVIEYCKKHVEAPEAEDRVSSGTVDEDLKLWDAEFVKVDRSTLFNLMLAANYLNIKNLLDLTCQTVADMIKGKTPEEIRKIFNIKNELTLEEEQEIRREYPWAFDDQVILKSSDGELVMVDVAVALEWQAIKDLIENCADSANVIPLFNVSRKILLKVIEYCKKHVNARRAKDRVSSGTVDEDLKLRDPEFVKVDLNTLFDLILAANYLDIESLLELTCQTVADMIKGKTPEEIRKTFNIWNKMTPEEEEEVRRENQWAFE